MYLPSEWHQQAFVQLTWPHKDTDWAPVLADAIDCFCEIAREVAMREPLLIVAQHPHEVTAELTKRNIRMESIHVAECLTNDTWARDHAFITCIDPQRKVILNDFQFNGWGLKFAANHDNQINRNILSAVAKFYPDVAVEYRNRLDFVFEGGSIESDGRGTLLTTSQCLLAPNRNQPLSQAEIVEQCYLSPREKEHYLNMQKSASKVGSDKVKAARRQFRGQGSYIEEILS